MDRIFDALYTLLREAKPETLAALGQALSVYREQYPNSYRGLLRVTFASRFIETVREAEEAEGN